jgi:hypothetical protein
MTAAADPFPTIRMAVAEERLRDIQLRRPPFGALPSAALDRERARGVAPASIAKIVEGHRAAMTRGALIKSRAAAADASEAAGAPVCVRHWEDVAAEFRQRRGRALTRPELAGLNYRRSSWLALAPESRARLAPTLAPAAEFVPIWFDRLVEPEIAVLLAPLLVLLVFALLLLSAVRLAQARAARRAAAAAPISRPAGA